MSLKWSLQNQINGKTFHRKCPDDKLEFYMLLLLFESVLYVKWQPVGTK